MTLKNLRNNFLREREEGSDVEEYYEIVKLIGEGSISNIYIVNKKNVGGSARNKVVSSSSCSLYDVLCFCRAANSTITPGTAVEGKDDNVEKGNENQEYQEYLGDTTTKRASYYAMKRINKLFVNDTALEELRNEINIFKALDHPNILKAYETFEEEQNISIITELLTGGDLYSRCPYSEKESALIVRKLLSAVCFMHDNKIVHRDLAFENIMFESKAPDAEIKLIDFGLSTKFINKNQYFTEQVGTMYSIAPEIIDEEYTSKCDLWSVGVITYMLLSGTRPFSGQTKGEISFKIKHHRPKLNGKEWAHVSAVAKDFVMKLLERNPKRRYSALEAQDHQWLHENNNLSDHRPSEDIMNGGHDSIVRYNSTGDFKKLALNVIAHQSNADDIVELKKMFDQYDTEKNGQITYTEFKEAMSHFNYNKEQIDEMFHSIDVDDNGIIYYNEFLASTLETRGRIAEVRLAEAFDRLDSDGSGFISKEDLRGMLGNHESEEYIDQLINEVDYQKDGKISYQEFLSVFQEKKGKEIKQVLDDNPQVKDSNIVRKIFGHFM